MKKKKYIQIKDLGVYRQALEISNEGWEIYKNFDWQTKKILGDQFIMAVDSIGANIAEGYGRFHYLDRAKFYYNARASLLEAIHWLRLLLKRKIISKEKAEKLADKLEKLSYSLNIYIKTVYKNKNETPT